jgi:hypothetical protein
MQTTNRYMIAPMARNWMEHDFYKSALVLGLDIGIEGIGVWLRKGRDPIFARSFMVTLPEAAPLKNRRAKRAQRHARQSLKQREAMLRQWIVRHGLLTQERLDERWNNPSVFERAFEHRYRAITGKVGSPECLVVCIRHIVRHRGFDYHLTDAGAFPWGDELDDKEIIQWAKTSCCAPEYRTHLFNLIEADTSWAKNTDATFTERYEKVRQALNDAVKEYENQPIERMLEAHMREKNHTHLRQPARGHNFARELVKQHLFAICDRHREFFAPGTFDQAMRELLGDSAGSGQWNMTWKDSAGKPQQTILDYHRKTPEEAKELWERKVKDCPFAPTLHQQDKLSTPKHKCSVRSDARIRRFNLLMFLAERRVELETQDAQGQRQNPRVNLDAEVVRQLMEDLEKDIYAVEALFSKQPAPRPDKPGKKNFEKRFNLSLAGVAKGSFNADFFDQLGDLLRPELRSLRQRASLSGEAAVVLYKLATNSGTTFEPAKVRQALEECDYYHWRANPPHGLGIYPQVAFLLGQRGHYDDEGNPTDKDKTSNPIHHGILRRLFAGQLRLDDGTGQGAKLIDLCEHLAGKTVPDYVIIETIGDIPRNQKEKKEFKDEIKANRSRKTDIIEKKYGLKLESLSDWQVKQVLLFDQQANDDGEAFSPYTGVSLGKNPLAHDLEVEHIYPEGRGGISIMDNLVITWRTENQTKGDQTPWEWLGQRATAQLQKMHWNRDKRALFVREESEPPQWDNTTRMAQIARYLRVEIIHWLGLDRIKNEMERNKQIAGRIGTPTGFQTSICRESWTPRTVFPQMYRLLHDKKGIPVRDQHGRERWVKDRTNLRHHLWDAAVLSHIPPREGLNSADYGGIFVHRRDQQTGEWRVSALPNLGPDLVAFEKENEGRCLVAHLRQHKSKRSRYKDTIFGLPDREQKHFAREPLSKYAGKKTDKELRKLLNRPGLLQPLEITNKKTGEKKRIQLLQEADVERWLACKDISLDPQEFRDFLVKLEVPTDRITNETVVDQFLNKKTGETRPKREFQAKHIIAFIRKKCGIAETEIPDLRVEDAFAARLERAVLRAANGRDGQLGQAIRRIPIEQDKLPPCGFGLHFNPTAEAKHGNAIAGFKAVDNSNSIVYLRREIWIGQKWKKKGKDKVASTFYESRLIPHPRHLAAYEKLHGQPWKSEPLPAGMSLAGCLAVGDLLRVPLKKEKKNAGDNLIAKRGEPPVEWKFYRVKSLKTEGPVEFQLAEFTEPKLAKDQIPDAATKRLLDICELSSRKDADLLWLLEATTGQEVQPPLPRDEPPPASPAKPSDELL